MVYRSVFHNIMIVVLIMFYFLIIKVLSEGIQFEKTLASGFTNSSINPPVPHLVTLFWKVCYYKFNTKLQKCSRFHTVLKLSEPMVRYLLKKMMAMGQVLVFPI